jgi:protein-S-isoprenylcysteine O-methyltransferase Ste14
VESSWSGARIFAWAGAALFSTSLAYFLFTYAFTFSETTTGALTAGALVTNIALFTVFALHHSVFARDRVRAWVSRRVPAALERSTYVWIASLMLIAVCAFWQPIPGRAWQVSGAAAWLFPAAQLAGVWLSLRSAAIIDVWDLAGVRQVLGRPEGRPQIEFKTDGPYGWVRHPIYLGWFLIVFSVATMTMTRLLFAVISSVYILVAIPFEERSLRRASGGTYHTYMKQVRWKLIPGLY